MTTRPVPVTRVIAGVLALLVLAAPVGAVDPPITALAVTPGGATILAGSQRGVWQLRLPTLKPLGKLRKPLVTVNAIRFSSCGGYLLVAGGRPGEEGEVQLYRWPSMAMLQKFAAGEDLVLDVVWSGRQPAEGDSLEGRQIISVGMDKKLRVFDADSGEQVLVREGHSRGLTAVVQLPGGQGLVTAGLDQSLRFWSDEGRASGKLEVVRALDNHRGPVLDLALRPKREGALPMVLSVSEDATVRFWQPTIGRMVRFASVPARPLQCGWLPGGHYAVVIGTDGRVRVIDPETVEVSWEAPAIDGWAYSLAVIPGGRQLVVGGERGQLVVLTIPDHISSENDQP